METDKLSGRISGSGAHFTAAFLFDQKNYKQIIKSQKKGKMRKQKKTKENKRKQNNK